MIDVRHLTKRFGTILAVDAVSFTVPQGEVLGFLGPNGAGKSTTMKMAAGFLNPTDGTFAVKRYRRDQRSHHGETKSWLPTRRGTGLS